MTELLTGKGAAHAQNKSFWRVLCPLGENGYVLTRTRFDVTQFVPMMVLRCTYKRDT